MLHLVNANGIDNNYHGTNTVLMATGTEKLPKGVQNQTPVSTMATRSKQAKKQPFSLERLPAVVLDKILGLLEPQDLRSFHQVSKAWQYTLSSRSYIESKRVDLVNKIRLNKENTARGKLLDSATPCTKQTSEPRNHDGKPGSRGVLSNRGRNSDNYRPPSSNSSRALSHSTSTPKSRFVQVYEAGNKLKKGQVLFRCPACSSPVASPVTSTHSQASEPFLDNTPKKSTASYLSLTHDSGFESIEVSADPNSSIGSSIAGDTSTEEISMSFIATPPQPGACIAQHEVTPHQVPIDGRNSSSSSRRCNIEMEAAKCPECNHRFCCKCQCTEHPGKPCKEIDGDSIRSESNGNGKVEKRKILRRLARI